jgi:hypothetical protein
MSQATLTRSQAELTTEKPLFKPFKRAIADILADLAKPVPDRFLDTRQQGGATLTYIPWYTVAKLLDYYAPGWEGTVTQMHTTRDRIFVIYRLTIHAQEGRFTREATGTELLKEDKPIKQNGKVLKDEQGNAIMKRVELAYGDPSSNAESMAFRRAAAKFGLGLNLYEKDDR